ncbi:hypothetical protein SLEP1_g28417 [Rubroshorea leprosula]|uniref:Uncharacterized protein n=1 Tax=Rubroshorea leprosula TaxID=152421 RepID=A0AAV5K0R5_9ROSI|nr:hypothetical protein SLEP1_g28417 [Rubroshorea leprosula]
MASLSFGIPLWLRSPPLLSTYFAIAEQCYLQISVGCAINLCFSKFSDSQILLGAPDFCSITLLRHRNSIPTMAEEDLWSMLSRIQIAEKDDGILPPHMVWKQNDANVGRLQLVGKLLSRQRVNLNGFHNVLMASWNQGRVLEVDEGFKKAVESTWMLRTHCEGHVKKDCEIAHCIKDAGGKIIRRFGPWLKVEFENSWCSDDFVILDDTFSTNTQFLVAGGNNDTGQVEGVNIENGTTDMGLGVEISQSHAVLSPIAEGSWKRLAHAVTSARSTENSTRNKRRSCLTPIKEERALKVLVNNIGVALAQSAKGHDPPAG